MNDKVFIKNSSEKFVDWVNKRDNSSVNSRELLREIPNKHGIGEVRNIILSSGINVGIIDCNLKKTIITWSKNESPILGLRFSISGYTKFKINCLKDDLEIKKGQTGFFYFPDMSGTSEELAGERIRRIMISIEPKFFKKFIREGAYGIPEKIKALIEKKNNSPFNITDKITAPMELALRQIINCPFQGLSRLLFIESKVLELLAYKMEQFSDKGLIDKQNKFFLKPDDLEKIYEAEKYLLENIHKPPDLALLSKETGMSRTKLLLCFSKVFGTSPTVYVRNKRFERARALLEEGKANVTEAAYSVGYSNLSHFSEMFKTYYGVLPGRFIKDRKFQSRV